MTQVLVWIEPHPIRNQFEEFFSHALFLAEAMLLLRDVGIKFRLFSNQQVLKRLAREYPAASDALLWPTDDETAFIEEQAGDWTENRLENWLDVVRGHGLVAERYQAIASRAIAEAEAQVVLLWSDNSAVRKAALDAGCAVLHFELGPTRPPFRTTFYIDPAGTNGLASFRSAPLQETKSADFDANALADPPVPQSTPLNLQANAKPDLSWLPAKPYAFLPLQLADDLNAQLHSRYASPHAFLKAAIPPLLESGLDVVVKGHPNVAARDLNVVAEDAALAFAGQSGAGVHVAPRHLKTGEQMALIGGSDLVCTVNSSIGFEALLLERPVVLLGDAAFDLGGVLKRQPEDLATLSSARDSAQAGFAIPAPMLRHFLHPKDEGTAHWVIAEAIAFAQRFPNVPFTDPAALADWTAAIDHASAPPVYVPGEPFGYISDIIETAHAGGVSVRVLGWAYDNRNDRPLPGFGVRCEGAPLAMTRQMPLRPDVTRAVGCRSCSVGIDLSFDASLDAWARAVFTIEHTDGQFLPYVLRRGRLAKASGTAIPAPAPTVRNGVQDLTPRNVLARVRNSAAMRLKTFRQ